MFLNITLMNPEYCSNYFCGNSGFANQGALYLRLPKQVLNVIDAALELVIKKVKPLLPDQIRNRDETYENNNKVYVWQDVAFHW